MGAKSRSLLSQAIIPEPATSQENVIQPLADNVVALVLQQHSPAHGADLLEFQDSLGNILSAVNNGGAFTGAAASPSGAVILAPSISTRNVITPAADGVRGLRVTGFSPSHSAPLFDASRDDNGSSTFIGSNQNLVVSTLNPSGSIATFNAAAGTSAGGQKFNVNTNYSAGAVIQNGFSIYTEGVFEWDAVTTTTYRGQAKMLPTWSDNVDATHKGQMDHQVRGHGANYYSYLTGGTDGTAPAIGILGAAPVIRQAGASATGIAAVLDANAKAALAALQAALAAYGLVTSPA